MTYYPDLSPYEYYQPEPSTLNVGWLDTAHDYRKGDVDDAFVERLWAFCHSRVHQSKGFQDCQFCGRNAFILKAQRGSETLSLGSAQIRVIGDNGIIYAAPDLIYYYVVEHHYRPPEEFVQAVMEGPLPGSPEYEALVGNLGK